ncbi:heavy metal translocating P-type ATPase [Lentilactobacillus sp. SPB1-3]|uniref:Heavy metal translocating P-type ATPase n=1 Tax=Lentilactobacillus terminaliae TaxID=3003483 RepID=A0ACD5DEQ0_9LACO|nr:heavy metal translocating P-type ATPase [Lentilactobacillus sp. SPB1-3]MCZ0976384.1 heavy metal translocating P-type ATPase [Lentilactobacillus sp. SPB1-3]
MKIKNYASLISVVTVTIVAATVEFLFHLPHISQSIITIAGTIIALTMFIDMIKTLRSGKFGVDLLAITAVIATLAVSEYWAALIVLLMLTGGDALEDYAANKANSELQTLLDNSPQTAHLIKDESLEDIEVDAVAVNDELLVKPGEIVPVDGVVLSSSVTIDESSLTGESLPVHKQVNDTIMSGSLNQDSSFKMIARKTAKDSQYQNIIQLVKEAEEHPAPFVRMADRYAVPFTIVAYLIAGIAWYLSKDPVRFAEVLVVASPCPLILAAPIALVSGMSLSSRNGIIVKSGTTIEQLAKAKSMAFDKTGTITQGQLTVETTYAVPGYTTEKVLTLAASAEQQSSHILARSLVKSASVIMPVEDVKEVTAQGIEAKINGDLIKAGKASFVTDVRISTIDQTAVYVSINNEYIGYVAFKDTLRPEAKAVMNGLHQSGIHNLLMISGDKLAIANQIATEVGIDHVYAEKLPEEKIQIVQQLPSEKKPVVMVGDGVNDAPSLATADVGIAMGVHGATAASESADAVILKDDLSLVVTARRIAEHTMQVARNAVLIGIIVCIILMLIASTGVIPAIIGALFQEVVDTVTILWALRARNY